MSTTSNGRGFTLLELLASSGIFLMVVWLAFAIFEFGSRASTISNLRANLQTSATRVILSLESDLRRSNYASITMVNRSVIFAGQTYRRDAICMAAVSNWSDPASFNSQFGFPQFDRYVIYYATTNNEGGRLVRSLANSTVDPLGGANPLSGFSEAPNFNNDPTLNVQPAGPSPGQINYTQLSEDVRNFSVVDGAFSQSVKASLVLFREGSQGPTGGQKRFDQSFQMDLELIPQNTCPKDAN